MIVRSAENSFHKGLASLKVGATLEAMAYFEAAMLRDRQVNSYSPNMKYQSYFGFCLARLTERRQEALKLCRQAADSEFYNPEVFLNLGRVALLQCDRQAAFQAFRRGLEIDHGHKELRQEVRRLGVRRRPLLGFLNRDHVLNRLAGRLRHSLGGA
jgi:tetratricopeptide (TPR) repeat protein